MFAPRSKKYLDASRREGLTCRPANPTARSGNHSYPVIHI
jgi:hypothetical protein